MEIEKNKELYDAPSTNVVEVNSEGIICQSGRIPNYNWNDIPEE